MLCDDIIGSMLMCHNIVRSCSQVCGDEFVMSYLNDL